VVGQALGYCRDPAVRREASDGNLGRHELGVIGTPIDVLLEREPDASQMHRLDGDFDLIA